MGKGGTKAMGEGGLTPGRPILSHQQLTQQNGNSGRGSGTRHSEDSGRMGNHVTHSMKGNGLTDQNTTMETIFLYLAVSFAVFYGCIHSF